MRRRRAPNRSPVAAEVVGVALEQASLKVLGETIYVEIPRLARRRPQSLAGRVAREDPAYRAVGHMAAPYRRSATDC